MLGGRLLRSSLNLEGHVDRLLKRGASLLFNRVNGLNIHLSDLQVVCCYVERQEVTGLIFLVHCILDDLSRIFMEILKRYRRHYTSDAGRDSLASITDEVLDREEVAALLLVVSIDFEVPSVRQSEEQFSVI